MATDEEQESDYDYAAWEKAGSPTDPVSGHAPDTFKFPNHPTFSDESMYHGRKGALGGHWDKDSEGIWSFTPGKTNLENFSPQELSEYFAKNEPNSRLKLPLPSSPSEPAYPENRRTLQQHEMMRPMQPSGNPLVLNAFGNIGRILRGIGAID